MGLAAIALFAGVLVGPYALVAQPTAAIQPTVDKLGDPGVTAPVKVKQVSPRYPVSAIRAGAQDVVDLQCVVLPDGTVGDVTITGGSSDPALRKAAVEAARQWTFKAGKKLGRPVAVSVPLEMTFVRSN